MGALDYCRGSVWNICFYEFLPPETRSSRIAAYGMVRNHPLSTIFAIVGVILSVFFFDSFDLDNFAASLIAALKSIV